MRAMSQETGPAHWTKGMEGLVQAAPALQTELMRSAMVQLWPFITYNCLFLWDYTFYKWGFVSTYNWYNSGHNCGKLPGFADDSLFFQWESTGESIQGICDILSSHCS